MAPPATNDELVKLLAEHVKLGEPLPFDVLDSRGWLLLRRGSVVSSEGQLERLIERGLYLGEADFLAHFGEPAAKVEVVAVELQSGWMRLQNLQDRLASLLRAIERGQATGMAAQPAAMALEARELCALDADAMLAAMTLLRHDSYAVRHSLCTALLVELMLARTPLTEAQRCSAVAGALMMNVGMLDLQDALYAQNTPLTDAQKAQVQEHPMRGAELLKAAGLDDPVCLAVVAGHHEHADGTGYPRRIAAPALPLEVQTVGLADRYCALIAERAYRSGAPSDQALKLIRERSGTTVDPVVLRLLVTEVGDYPPGCPVRLVNNESGIVLRRTREPGSRVVKALRSALNAVYEDGPRRLSGQPAFAIDRVIKLSDLGIEVDPQRLWGDSAVVRAG